MELATSARTRHRVFAADPRDFVAFRAALWEALRLECDALPDDVAQGVASYELHDGFVRTCHSAAESFLAIEVVSLDKADAFELFHVRLSDDRCRVGWHRRGRLRDVPPDPWEHAANVGALGAELLPKVAPSFLTLAAQLLAVAPVSVSATDAEERRLLLEEATYWRETAEHQAEVITQLRLAASHVSASVESPVDPQGSPERTLADIGVWAAEHSDSIVVLGRAIAGAKKSIYEDVELVYAALDLLATTYREVKLGQRDRMDLRDHCLRLGLEIGGSVDPSRADDTYYVRWGGRRRFLDQHLARGTSRDPRLCLRIYFTWDEDEQKVIIGWLPTHLTNSRT
jgi:hypothetical protein